VSGDNLALAQDLKFAPAAGVGLGRAILYKPKDEEQPTLSLIHYSASGAATELITGARVASMTTEFAAGQLINSSYSLQGIEYLRNFIEITASTRFIDFNDGASKSASIEAKFYKHPHELAEAIQTAMNSVTSDEITVIYHDTGVNKGRFTIASDGAVFELEFLSGANTANSIATKIGFLVADYDLALSYTSVNELDLTPPFTPAYDTANPLAAKFHEVMIGDKDDVFCFGAQSLTLNIENEITPIPDICERSGRAGNIISSRTISVEVVALMQKHDVDKFKRYVNNEDVIFTYNAGEKFGGNWKAGTCVNIHIPTASISAFNESDGDGLRVINFTVSAYVKDAQGECYINLL
jgi:hypothetical protein